MVPLLLFKMEEFGSFKLHSVTQLLRVIVVWRKIINIWSLSVYCNCFKFSQKHGKYFNFVKLSNYSFKDILFDSSHLEYIYAYIDYFHKPHFLTFFRAFKISVSFSQFRRWFFPHILSSFFWAFPTLWVFFYFLIFILFLERLKYIFVYLLHMHCLKFSVKNFSVILYIYFVFF